jgi:hypothetical protein
MLCAVILPISPPSQHSMVTILSISMRHFLNQLRGRRSERPHQIVRIGLTTAKELGNGSTDVGLDNALFAPVVAAELMQVV